MNSKSLELLEKYVPKTYIQQAHQNTTIHQNEIRILLEKVKLPHQGWPDDRIKLLLNELSTMDSNNTTNVCGLGEREGRVLSDLVKQRNYGSSSLTFSLSSSSRHHLFVFFSLKGFPMELVDQVTSQKCSLKQLDLRFLTS